jgi:hypothetical protein
LTTEGLDEILKIKSNINFLFPYPLRGREKES